MRIVIVTLALCAACTSISNSSNVCVSRGPWISLHDLGKPTPEQDANVSSHTPRPDNK
jgi:hypothetical protein